jgi:hypothetical protein
MVIFMRAKQLDQMNFERLVQSSLIALSNVQRGTLQAQIAKLWQAMHSTSGTKWGPLTFSGGVKALLYKDMMAILSQNAVEHYNRLDNKLTGLICYNSHIPETNLDLHELSQLGRSLREKLKFFSENHRNASVEDTENTGKNKLCDLFPFLLISRDPGTIESLEKVWPSLKKAHPLLKKFGEECCKRKYWMRSIADIESTMKNKGKENQGGMQRLERVLRRKKFAFIDIYV